MKLQIRQERLKNKWTQEYVANKVNITPESVSLIETGRRKPSYDVLVKLEDLFGKTHRELFAVAHGAQTKNYSS